MEETIGERVRRLRKARDWTQVALAYNAGRAPSVVSQIETGKREPELSTVKSLAEALEVDWRYLLLGDQLPKVPAPIASGQPNAGENAPSGDDDQLVPLKVGLERMLAAGNAAQEVARHDWPRALARSLEEGRPLTRCRILEMYSFHNELSRWYVGAFKGILEGARMGIVGITNKGVNEPLSPDPERWPQELKEPLYEAGARIAALPNLIKKIELEASEQRLGAAERSLFKEFNVEDHLPAEVLQGPGWREERNKALEEVGA
jgi:transcriptional regulator with XRE-family HTH domain